MVSNLKKTEYFKIFIKKKGFSNLKKTKSLLIYQ
jgi:hypothetical protein